MFLDGAATRRVSHQGVHAAQDIPPEPCVLVGVAEDARELLGRHAAERVADRAALG